MKMKSSARIKLDNQSYLINDFGHDAKQLIQLLSMTNEQIQECNNMTVLLNRAKNAYIQDLSAEIVKDKSGVDLEALFTDDDF